MPTFGRTQQATRAGTPRRAGAKPGIIVEGVDALVQSFVRDVATVTAGTSALVVEHAGKVGNRMRSTVPIDQGDVLDSISSDRTATVEGAGVFAEAGPDRDENPAAFVAPFLVNGTVKMAPRWDVQSIADEALTDFERAMKALSRL